MQYILVIFVVTPITDYDKTKITVYFSTGTKNEWQNYRKG